MESLFLSIFVDERAEIGEERRKDVIGRLGGGGGGGQGGRPPHLRLSA